MPQTNTETDNNKVVLSSRNSIKSFLVLVSVFFSALGFILIYSSAYQANKNAIINNTQQLAEQYAEQTMTSFIELKKQGWPIEQINRFIQQQPIQTKPFQATLISAEQVLNAPDTNNWREQQQNSLLKAEVARFVQDDVLIIIWPVNDNNGDTTALLEMQWDISNNLSNAKNSLLTNLLYLSPIPLLLAFFVIAYINKKVNNSVNRLENSIEQINKVSDLNQLSLQDTQQGFTELNHIYSKIEKLSHRMHDLAVDKDLLEFEIQLLEKFVITSEVVRDWHAYIDMLLIEINAVMHVYNLFSIFKVDDEMFSIEVFWMGPPTEDTKKRLDEKIHESIEAHSIFKDNSHFDVQHHVADNNAEPIELGIEDIQLQTKSLFLEQPNIGGIVGIGVNSEISEDSTRLLVTGSILSTLINVVGSVKAIYKYTKDLEYYATRDPLTNLHNQRIYWEMLDYEISRANRHGYEFTVLMIDMDNFKSINDNYGHGFGDKTLQLVSNAIRDALRNGDFLSRYGGDEFAVILPESDIEQAMTVAERILKCVHDMTLKAPDDELIDVSMSIGIAVYPDHADNSRDLFMFADNMMYKAKMAGKNRLYIPHDDDILEVFRDINEKSVMINKAVKDRNVIPYFQPLLALASGEIHAVEVLCRILTPNNQIMGAHEFIEIAEKMGIIHNIDFIMLEKALEIAEQESYQGLIFVNISPRSLVLSEFVPEINRVVEAAGIARNRIVFEITERDTVKNMTLLKKFVSNLKAEGYQLAVDDFGSGFSSFHYLKHFPIDFVKIDGEFVANMVNSPKDHAVVRCISNLAHELQAMTIAEYVESEEVLQAIKEVGITYAQGYHIRRPTPYILTPEE